MKFALRVLLTTVLPVLTPAGEQNELETVKSDLGTLAAERAGLGQEKISLPSIDGPSAPTLDRPVTLSSEILKRTGTEQRTNAKKSQNWLLDAMDKENERADSRRALPGNRSLDRDRLDKERAQPFGASEKSEIGDYGLDAERVAKPTAREIANETVPANNPLMPFMADWISKRDMDLLLPRNPAEPRFDENRAFFSPGTSLDAQSTITLGDIGRTAETAAAPALRTQDNPYLSGLALPNAVGPASSQLLVPAPASSDFDRRSSLTVERPKDDRQPTPSVDLSKPDQDAKFFPQLKRF